VKLDEKGIPELKDDGFGLSSVLSVLFHIFVIVGIPFLAKLLYHEPKFDLPPTFELMAIPTQTDEMSTEIPTSQTQQPEIVEEPVPEPTPVPEEVVSMKKPDKKEEPKKEVKKPDPKKTEPKKEEKPKLSKQQVAAELDNIFDGPPKKGGSSSSGSATEMSYEGEIVRRIEHNWNPTVSGKTPIVGVRYAVARNGTLIYAKKVQSSGNALLDLQAVRAVELAFPMPPIPSEITTVPFIRTYELDPNKK